MLEDQFVSNDDSPIWDDNGYADCTSYHMLTDQYTDDENDVSSHNSYCEAKTDNLNY